MHRLYLRFYFTLLASLIFFALIVAVAWHSHGGPANVAFEIVARIAQNALGPAGASAEAQQAVLGRLVDGLNIDVSLYGKDHRRLAAVGAPIFVPEEYPDKRIGARSGNRIWRFDLADGRILLIAAPNRYVGAEHLALAMLVILALAVGVAAYPVMRHLSRRLERLQTAVDALGSGDLSARVAVEGRDEVAQLALSFNRAAERIEDLIRANKSLLANASHELRTPLARIRLAVELMKQSAEPKRKAGLEQDIAELDLLIDEILLASRLDAIADLDAMEELDLLALAAEEGARYDDVHIDGGSLMVLGDARLLRRLLRNLVENAFRHGVPPVQISLARQGNFAQITVSDAGLGVPPAEFERIFEPFYRRSGATENIGVGLGLALVKQIARRHGGEAYCMTSGEGSIFVVTLICRR